MNCVLKMNLKSGVILEPFINNSKYYNGKSYICGHCLRRHPIFHNRVQRFSHLVTALKLMLKKQETVNKAEKVVPKNIKHSENNKKNTKYAEIVNVTPCKSLLTRMSVQKIKPNQVQDFAEQPGLTFRARKPKCTYDSTRSYDPNFFILTSDLGNVTSNIVKNKKCEKLTSNNNVENVVSELKNNKIEQNPSLNSNFSETIHNRDKYSVLTPVQKLPRAQDVSKKSINTLNLPKKGAALDQKNQPTDPFPLVKLKQNESESPDTNLKRDFIKMEYTFISESDYLQYLHSFVDICITKNNKQKAFTYLYNIQNTKSWKLFSKNKKSLTDVYNTLLGAFSKDGDWKNVETISMWMLKGKVPFSSESFANMFYCLGKFDSFDKKPHNVFILEKTSLIMHWLLESNMSLNDVFSDTNMTREKGELILNIIHTFKPDFEVEPHIIDLNAKCPLLKDLYLEQSDLRTQADTSLTEDLMEKLVEEQLLLEKQFFVKVQAVSSGYKNKEFSPFEANMIDRLKTQWRKNIHSEFLRRLSDFDKPNMNLVNLKVYLTCLPPETFVDIMMNTVEDLVHLSAGYSPSTYSLSLEIAQKVFNCYIISKKLSVGEVEKITTVYKKYSKWYLNPSAPASNNRQKWQMITQDPKNNFNADPEVVIWPRLILIKLGRLLYNIIFTECKFYASLKNNPQFIPVFYPVIRFKKHKTFEEVKVHPEITKLYENRVNHYFQFPANQIPMLCPPKPWKAANHGGYLLLTTEFVRPGDKLSGKAVNFNKLPNRQLYAVFDSLNALQAVPWIVNEKVLDVALSVFKNGGSKELNIPSLPDRTPIEIFPTMPMEERIKSVQEKQEILNQRQCQYALWCEALYKFSLANHFRKKIFWLPQNCDFRGRVYPVPPHLNHLGADLFRSLLLFAKGKPLGPNGLNWLKIHTINLTGTHKKKSLKERLEYADLMLPEILDSAENPLTGRKWWVKSDDPWQTLAACLEIKSALSVSNPENYVCRFPIHQDGSCNGLQHYAALGRDSLGARSVNLTKTELPQDVYITVAEVIEKERLKDEEKGVEIAKILRNYVTRKVIKQTIMTTVYGVTAYGARNQIERRLEEYPDFPKEYLRQASLYLTEKTFYCYKQMFTSAREIQNWFNVCGKLICKNEDYVEWVTHLGFPVVQSYARQLVRHNNKILLPYLKKQSNAFPPNFIHSLDSTHMMLTAMFSEQAGITFASVHDCFWTHPCSVEIMSKICRQQFIALHSLDILKDLSEQFQNYYSKNSENHDIFSSTPKTGDFAVEEVMNSVYFFS